MNIFDASLNSVEGCGYLIVIPKHQETYIPLDFYGDNREFVQLLPEQPALTYSSVRTNTWS